MAILSPLHNGLTTNEAKHAAGVGVNDGFVIVTLTLTQAAHAESTLKDQYPSHLPVSMRW